MHEIAFPWLKKAKAKEFELIVASHTLAELYAVLTTLPVKPRISPINAWKLVNENIESIASIVSLSPTEYSSTIKRMSEQGLSGGIIYDALIAKVAQKAKVERLLTLNINHFKKVWSGDESILYSAL
jgi:predicted nucleic acid-binding protein